jgi:hypothetical protein
MADKEKIMHRLTLLSIQYADEKNNGTHSLPVRTQGKEISLALIRAAYSAQEQRKSWAGALWRYPEAMPLCFSAWGSPYLCDEQ